MTEYVGIWNGGAEYRESEWAIDAEIFTSLDQAAAVLADRYALGYVLSPRNIPKVAEWDTSPYGPTTFARAGHENHNLIAPCVAMGSTILLADRTRTNLETLETDGPYACTHRLEIGPRGGVRITKL